MKRVNANILWIVMNVVWWISSIYLGFVKSIDLNPFLGNGGEVFFNLIIFLLGLLAIMTFTKDSEAEENDVVEADFTEEPAEESEDEKEAEDGSKTD